MKEQLDAINKWFFFCMNYPHDFIQSVWADTPGLAAHFESKFNGIYDSRGSDAAMTVFYAELSWGNRKKLLDWVLENYSGEQKPLW